MYIDFISYRLAENITESDFKKVAKDVFESWMKHQEGFISWQINRINTPGKYTDIVCWKDKNSAQKAKENMNTLPSNIPWISCYDPHSISSYTGEEVFFKNTVSNS